ncbi:hypothetical protein ACNKHV_15545 [Shigella flexneri]
MELQADPFCRCLGRARSSKAFWRLAICKRCRMRRRPSATNRLQQQSQGASTSSFTHGTSQQRYPGLNVVSTAAITYNQSIGKNI